MEKEHLPLVRRILDKSGLESDNIITYGAQGMRQPLDAFVEKAILLGKHGTSSQMKDIFHKAFEERINMEYDAHLGIDLRTYWVGRPERRVWVQVRISTFENFSKWGIESKAAVIGNNELCTCEAHLFLHIYLTSSEKLKSKCWMLFDWRKAVEKINNMTIPFVRHNNALDKNKKFILVKYDDLRQFAVNYDMSGFVR